MPDRFEQPQDLGALTWRVRTLEERQREEHDQMIVALDKVRHEMRDRMVEVRETLRTEYLNRDQLELSYPSRDEQRVALAGRQRWGLLLVGLLSGASAFLQILERFGHS